MVGDSRTLNGTTVPANAVGPENLVGKAQVAAVGRSGTGCLRIHYRRAMYSAGLVHIPLVDMIGSSNREVDVMVIVVS